MHVIDGILRANTSYMGVSTCCCVHAHQKVRSLKAIKRLPL